MIGLFDSGVGGLTVVKELIARLPQYDVVYFGDTARLPYGNKSEETIIKYSLEDAQFLFDEGAKIIIIACHTASAIAAEQLRAKAGERVPIFDVVLPALEKAIGMTKNKKIGLIGTQATVTSGTYEKMAQKMDPTVKIFSKACPLFVPLIEEGHANRPETKRMVRFYLKKIKDYGIDTLIVGCTHYPLIQKQIADFMGQKVKLVNPGKEVIERLAAYLEQNKDVEAKLSKGGKLKFFVSDDPEKFKSIASRFLGSKAANVEKVRVGAA